MVRWRLERRVVRKAGHWSVSMHDRRYDSSAERDYDGQDLCEGRARSINILALER